jgi:hypothetical protein
MGHKEKAEGRKQKAELKWAIRVTVDGNSQMVITALSGGHGDLSIGSPHLTIAV